MPAYPYVFQLLKSRPDAIFVDVGCCRTNLFLSRSFYHNLIDVCTVGTELRKIVYDGWPISQAIGTDVEAGRELGGSLHSRKPNSCFVS